MKGNDVDQITKERNIQATTVMGYLAAAAEAGRPLDFSRYFALPSNRRLSINFRIIFPKGGRKTREV